MLCQSQAFPTEKSQKKPDFVCFLWFSQKNALKKARISKSGFRKTKLATLSISSIERTSADHELFLVKKLHFVITTIWLCQRVSCAEVIWKSEAVPSIRKKRKMKKVEDMSRQDRCDRWQDQLSQLRHYVSQFSSGNTFHWIIQPPLFRAGFDSPVLLF